MKFDLITDDPNPLEKIGLEGTHDFTSEEATEGRKVCMVGRR